MTSEDTFEAGPTSRGLFSLVAGLYAAALLAPAATLVLSAGEPTWQAYTTLLGNVFVVTVLVAIAVGRVERPLAVRLGRTRLTWGLAAAGLPYGAWLLAVGPGDAGGGAVLLAMLGLFGAGFLGAIGYGMARTRAVHDRLAGEPVRARWEAAAPPARRRRAVGIGGGLLVAGLVGMGAGIAAGVPPLRYAGQLIGPAAAAVAAGTTAEREYLVVDRGLVVRAPANLRLVPWERFDEFAVTDDALLLRRTSPWRLDVACDRDAVEDVDAARAALAEHLPET